MVQLKALIVVLGNQTHFTSIELYKYDHLALQVFNPLNQYLIFFESIIFIYFAYY